MYDVANHYLRATNRFFLQEVEAVERKKSVALPEKPKRCSARPRRVVTADTSITHHTLDDVVGGACQGIVDKRTPRWARAKTTNRDKVIPSTMRPVMGRAVDRKPWVLFNRFPLSGINPKDTLFSLSSSLIFQYFRERLPFPHV